MQSLQDILLDGITRAARSFPHRPCSSRQHARFPASPLELDAPDGSTLSRESVSPLLRARGRRRPFIRMARHARRGFTWPPNDGCALEAAPHRQHVPSARDIDYFLPFPKDARLFHIAWICRLFFSNRDTLIKSSAYFKFKRQIKCYLLCQTFPNGFKALDVFT